MKRVSESILEVKDPLICIDGGVVVEVERLDREAGGLNNQSQNPATSSGQVHGASNTSCRL